MGYPSGAHVMSVGFSMGCSWVFHAVPVGFPWIVGEVLAVGSRDAYGVFVGFPRGLVGCPCRGVALGCPWGARGISV